MPGNTTRSFSLQFCAVHVSSFRITGFAPGEALSISYANDDFEEENSSDGETIWVQKHNNTADVTLRLGQGTPLVQALRQLHELSLAAGGISYPFTAKNLKSPDEIVTGTVMIKKRPDLKWADSAQAVEVSMGLQASQFAGGTITPT